MKTPIRTGIFLAGAALFSLAQTGAASATDILFVADNLTDGSASEVLEFSTAGGLPTSFTTSGAISGLASNGADVFVSLPGSIAEYDTSGNLLASFSLPASATVGPLALAGGTLYAAADVGVEQAVVKFNASNLTQTGFFLTPGVISGLASDGKYVYASLPGGVSEYDAAGNLLTSLPADSSTSVGSLALGGGDLYVAAISSGLAGIAELEAPNLIPEGGFATSNIVDGLVTYGPDLIASEGNALVLYDDVGNILGASSGGALDSYGALAIASVPEPSTWAMMLIGFAGLGFAGYRRQRASVKTARA